MNSHMKRLRQRKRTMTKPCALPMFSCPGAKERGVKNRAANDLKALSSNSGGGGGSSSSISSSSSSNGKPLEYLCAKVFIKVIKSENNFGR